MVVTHDRGGEYGHGAHKVTADASVYCVENAANPSVLPALCEAYGAWTVKKLYLHMGEENVIRMDWNVPLSAMGGKTANSSRRRPSCTSPSKRRAMSSPTRARRATPNFRSSIRPSDRISSAGFL